MDESLVKSKKHLFQAITALLMILSLVSIAAFFLVFQLARTAQGVGERQNTITVTGRGEVLAVPDVAELSFSVMEEAKTVALAQEKSTKKINDIVAFLKAEDIDEKDIKTTNYSVQPQYEYYYWHPALQVRCLSSYCPPPYIQKNEIIGYQVSQWIQIKARNINEAGAILAGIGERGVSNVSGINFVVDDKEALKVEAREMAIADARDQATKLVKNLGVRLGKVVNYSESGDYPYPIMYGRGGYGGDMAVGMPTMMTKEAPSPEVPSGQNEIISIVSVTYEIK